MRQQRDPALAGHHQRQPDQAQIGAFLFGLAALRDRRLLVRGVDVGGEVGHIQHQSGQVQPELAHHAPAQLGLDRLQAGGVQAVHRVPEPAVIQRRAGQLGEPGPGRAGPPVREGQLRARVHDPVRGRQRDVGAHRRRRAGVARHHRVDHPGDVQTLQQRPHRRQVPELLVLRADRLTPSAAGQLRHHLFGAAQVLLRHDPWLAVHPRRLHQVVVRLVPLTLPHDRSHI